MLIRDVLTESGGGWASPPEPVGRHGRVPGMPDITNREQLGRMASGTPPTDEIAPHLMEPTIDPDWGPVPPREHGNQDEYDEDGDKGIDPFRMTLDPLTRDTQPTPTRTKGVMR